jgi:competence protein ComEC
MSTTGGNSGGEPRPAPGLPPLVVLLVAVSAGIVADRYGDLSEPCWLCFALAAGLAWYPLWRCRAERVSAAVLLTAATALGAAWHHDRWQLFPAGELGCAALAEPQPVVVEAVTETTPRRLPAPPADPLRTRVIGERTQLTVRIRQVRDGAAWRPAAGLARLTVEGHLLGVQVGDVLQVAAHVQRPSSPQNPGEFDVAARRRAQRQLCQLSVLFPDCVRPILRGSPWSPARQLAAVRERCHDALWKYLHERQASLATAVLLGVREELLEERTQEFFYTGTIHILSISGMHVALLAFGFWWLTRLFAMQRRLALLAAASFVVVYTLLTEAEPPVVRATVLIVLVCAARWWGRRSSGFNVLAAAALVILAWNPVELFQIGSQLSFLAVATIYYFTRRGTRTTVVDPLDRLLAQSRPWPVRAARHLGYVTWEGFVLGALIWLLALPVTMYRFHLVSPIAIVLNPLIAIPMALALFSGFGVLFFGWLLPPVGQVCGWLCNLNLMLLEETVSWGQRQGMGYFWTSGPELWWVLGLYGGLAVAATRPRWLPPRRWCWTLLTAWLAVGVCSSGQVRRLLDPAGNRQLACTFVSVGHGTCVVLELPHGQTLMYDAGRLGAPEGAVQSISAFLWSRDIAHLDAVVLSHADADHFNSLPGLLQRFSVGAVYVSPVMFAEPNPALESLQRALQESGVPVRELFAGDHLVTSGATGIEVLHPPRTGERGGDNANSIVLQLDHVGRRLLLAGDLAPPGLDSLLAEEPRLCNVVLALHHGSMRNNPRGFAAWATPQWVIVSDAHGEKAETMQQALAKPDSTVWHTALEGAIRVTLDEREVAVRGWRRDPW